MSAALASMPSVRAVARAALAAMWIASFAACEEPVAPAPQCTTNEQCAVTEACSGGRCVPIQESDCLAFDPPVGVNPKADDALRGTLSFEAARPGDERAVTVTVTNRCRRDVTLGAAFAASTSAEFSLSREPAVDAVPGSGELRLQVRYRPVDAAEERAGQQLELTADDAPARIVYDLHVAYQGAPELLVAAAPDDTEALGAWNFGEVALGEARTKTIFVVNASAGARSLTVSDLRIEESADFAVSAPTLPLQLAPRRVCADDGDCGAGLTCSEERVCARDDGSLVGVQAVEVTYAPKAAGSSLAQLVIVHDGGQEFGSSDLTRTPVVLSGGGGNPPTLVVQPSPVEFGDVQVGADVARSVRLTNAGDRELVVSAARLRPGSAAGLKLDAAGTLRIAGGASRDLTVRFAPRLALGDETGTLELTSNDPQQPSVTVAIHARSVNPQAVVSPRRLDFEAQRLAAPPTTRLVTVRNAGDGTLHVTAVRLADGGDESFALPVPPTLPHALGRGEKLDLVVEFAPRQVGVLAGVLEIETDDVDLPRVEVDLFGIGGVPPEASVEPAVLELGEVRAGQFVEREVVVRNTGERELVFESVRLSGATPAAFSVTPATLDPLPAGGEQVLLVRFAPSTGLVGPQVGHLLLDTNDPNAAALVVTLHAAAIDVAPNVTPTALDFGHVRLVDPPADLELTLRPLGFGTLTLTGAVFVEGSDPDFALHEPPELPVALADASARQVLRVRFTPQELGTRRATLRLEYANFGPTHVVIVGEGGTAPRLRLEPVSIDLGEVQATTHAGATVTVHNDGDQTLVLSGLHLKQQNDFSFSPSALGPITGLSSREVTVRFDAARARLGQQTNTFELFTNATATPSGQVSLTATATDPALSLSTSAIDFGHVRLADVSARRDVTLTNSGTGTLKITALTFQAGSHADYSLVPASLPIVLAQGQSATVGVVFAPQAFYTRTATLVVATDDVDQPAHTVAITGEGGSVPSLQIAPASLAFGLVQVGATAQRTFTITNAGEQPLDVSALTVTGTNPTRYSASPNGAATIAGGQSRTVTVTYATTAGQFGQAPSTLSFTTNDPSRASGQVTLTGETIAPDPTLSPVVVNLVDFVHPTPRAPTQTFTLGNAGVGPYTLTQVATQSTGLSVVQSTLPRDVAQGSTTTVTVNFTPASVTAGQSKVVFHTNDREEPTLEATFVCECSLAHVSSWTCNAGQCGVSQCASGHHDVDGDPWNGCECPFRSAIDLPDDDFIDANCDGIDGDVALGVFVSPSGNDAWAGTQAAPKRSLSAAIAFAEANGKRPVYVATGDYTESATLELKEGVNIYGGYHPTTWQRSDTKSKVTVSHAIAVRANGIDVETTLDRLHFVGANATGAGASAYGLFATNSTGLRLRHTHFAAGKGAPGSAGTTPSGTGAHGTAGSLGGKGCEDSGGFCSSCSRPQGGAGGTNGSCTAANGGRGGNAGYGSSWGSPGSASPGGAAGGSGTPPYQKNWDPTSAYWGRDGTAGTPGSNGAAGALGAFGSSGFAPVVAGNGTAGQHGVGGGGGGGGGGGDNACDSYGGGGAGGGAGGCGGAAATGGQGGGASIAVYLWNSPISLESCTLETAGGGNGGQGGTGQPGGNGGAGGRVAGTNKGNEYGGSGEQDDGSNGARGGDGGNGGRGGHGGGGRGGPSIGVAYNSSGGAPTITSVVDAVGVAGTGGPSSGDGGGMGLRSIIHPY